MEIENWNNRYEVMDAINKHEVPYIIEVLENEYDTNEDNYFDHAHEIIDGHEYVIYNYQAKKVCEAFDLDPFGESEITGEQNTSYNQMAYELLEQKVMELIYDKYNK